MRILLGDTRSRRNQELFQVNGWGRMFASDRPFPPFFYPSEVWGFDNGAFVAWTRGNQFPEGVFLRRLDAALRVETGPSGCSVPRYSSWRSKIAGILGELAKAPAFLMAVVSCCSRWNDARRRPGGRPPLRWNLSWWHRPIQTHGLSLVASCSIFGH